MARREGTFIINFEGNKDMRTFNAVVVKEEGIYVASCLETGTVSQGRTVKKAIENLRQATTLYLEERPSKPLSKPRMVRFEVALRASPA
jgi:predicted RNase H-like HicB family nuclease